MKDTNNSRSEGTGKTSSNDGLVGFRRDFEENVEQGPVVQEIRS